jgi:protein-disulfide isomerase
VTTRRRILLPAILLALAGCEGQGCEDSDKPKPTSSKDAAAIGPEPDPITLEGVDISPLTSREKKEFAEYVSTFLSPCSDVPVSIAQCIQEKRSCGACVPAARFVARGVRAGQARDQIEKAYKNRFDPAAVKDVPIDGSPCTGSDIAPVTIVEFADFECSACGAMFPRMHALIEEKKSSIRFCYKFFPLPTHPHGESAARAGVAAISQGKFWEMHDKMFKNQLHLEDTDLASYAKEVGMDPAKLRADMASQATTDRLTRDKELGHKLGVNATPSIFINGRQFDGMSDLGEWVSMEIAGASKAPTPVSTATDAGAKDAAPAAASKDASAALDAKK